MYSANTQLVCPICPMFGFNKDNLIDHLVCKHVINRDRAVGLVEEALHEEELEIRTYEARN